MGDELPVHVSGEFQTAKHLVLGFVAVRGLSLVVSLFGRARDLAVGAESLELDEIRPGLSSRIDQLLGQPDVAVMVDAGFGDDESSVGHDLSLPTNRA